MGTVNNRLPFKCKAVYLKDSKEPLQNKIVFILDNFVIVAADEKDTAPTWYNVDKVDRLEGMEILAKAGNKQTMRVTFL